MKKQKRIAILVIALAAILSIGWAERISEDVAIEKAERTESDLKEIALWTAQEEWLAKLELCESSGNPKAINEEDLDGTPSYGLLQFKPSTFDHFSNQYGIEGELMDPEAQRAIVRRMMGDQDIRWENQFPGCVRKLGRPPQP